MKAVVAGAFGTYPVGGVAWTFGAWLRGFARLGYETWYLEDTGLEGWDPERGDMASDGRYAAGYVARALPLVAPEVGERWHLRAADGSRHGASVERVRQALADADVLVNLSAMLMLRPEYRDGPATVLLDTDPGHNHFAVWPRWDRGEGWPGVASWRDHDVFCTYATNLGEPDCPLPTLGVAWHRIVPPVDAAAWRPAPLGERWTTVMSWGNYSRPIEHAGRTYGSREREFPKVEALPSRVDVPLEVAVGGGGVDAPVERWRAAGWSVVDAGAVSASPEQFRDYVLGSRGELAVAKHVYAATRSGWVSDRTTCYLAAGRPAVVQDTGFTAHLPVGEGLLAFADLEGARRAIAAVEADPGRHAEAARHLAETTFAADRVCARVAELATGRDVDAVPGMSPAPRPDPDAWEES